MPRWLTSVKRFEKNHIPVTETGCWLWEASVDGGGYGQFYANGKKVLAHRFSYEQKHGPIPEDLEIDHLCSVRSCVNPDHLEAVTSKENSRRGRNFNNEKTRCPQGHQYSGKNLYVRPDGKRGCIICRRQYLINFRMRKRNIKK